MATKQKMIDKMIAERNRWRKNSELLALECEEWRKSYDSCMDAYNKIWIENNTIRAALETLADSIGVLTPAIEAIAKTKEPLRPPTKCFRIIQEALEPHSPIALEVCAHNAEASGRTVGEELDAMPQSEIERFNALEAPGDAQVGGFEIPVGDEQDPGEQEGAFLESVRVTEEVDESLLNEAGLTAEEAAEELAEIASQHAEIDARCKEALEKHPELGGVVRTIEAERAWGC